MKTKSRSKSVSVYIVRCSDNSLYTGVSRDLKARVLAHNAGRGAKYTKAHRPVVLVYSEKCRSRSQALRREYQIKQWSKARKETLISSAGK
jgi:putative endonuclease